MTTGDISPAAAGRVHKSANKPDNEMSVAFLAKSENESFARVCVAAFAARLDPTVADLTDIKTAVSEAVTNAIIHGYENDADNYVYIKCAITGGEIVIEVRDEGVGIPDIKRAMEPLYTSKPELERSGMGFTMMETFMDKVDVWSEVGKGTKITMYKQIL